jgi:hypothetical protein
MAIGLYAKALAGAAVAGLTAAITGLADGSLSGYEWTVVAGAVLVALAGIFTADNVKWFKYAKAVTAALIAAVGALGVALLDGGGVSSAELLGLLVALLGSGGLTAVVPNAVESDVTNVALADNDGW